MTPIPEPPRQYRLGITAEEAEGARQVLAHGLRPPVPEHIDVYHEAAVSVFAKLTSIVDAAKQPKVEP
jgi:hypothetical protein